MNYRTAIYTDDYLTLLELMQRIDKELPGTETMIFGPKGALDEFMDSGELLITDTERISEADILVLLSEPSSGEDAVRDFDGTIIDCVGYSFAEDAEVRRVEEPVGGVLKNVAARENTLSAVIQLPVCVFGRDGVEDLMNQTKDVFTFESRDGSVFTDRIAFNVHFFPAGLSALPVGRSVDEFVEAGGDAEVRIYPLSTVFTVDVFCSEPAELRSDEGYMVPSGFFAASDLAERNDIFVIPRRNGFTFAGDYIRVRVEGVMKNLKEVSGK